LPFAWQLLKVYECIWNIAGEWVVNIHVVYGDLYEMYLDSLDI